MFIRYSQHELNTNYTTSFTFLCYE